MPNLPAQLESASQALAEIAHLRFACHYPLSQALSFKAGGPGDLVAWPHSQEAILACLQVARDFDLPVTILGRGSNVLVSDRGIRGLVVILASAYSKLDLQNSVLTCQAGCPLYQLAAYCARQGLSGVEGLVGIPGSLGGAVMMNAGAYDYTLGDLVTQVTYIDDQLHVETLSHADLDFAYRHSYFSDHPGLISQVSLLLKPASPQEIYAKMADFQARRRKSQPLELASAGSSFKRPQGAYASRLIETAGLKGWRHGSCGVSAKHAGFIVNYGGATAQDLRQVFAHVQAEVKRQSGFSLEPEVRFLGDWS